MTIKIVGKAHLQGTSKKTGKDYNFFQLHFNAPARGVDGLAAKTVSVDPSLIDYADILIGEQYDLCFDMDGFCIQIDPCF